MSKPLEFIHTTYNEKVFVYPDQIFAVCFLPTMKSVALIGPGSTAIPVIGTIVEIENKVTAAKNAAATNPQRKEVPSGISRRKHK